MCLKRGKWHQATKLRVWQGSHRCFVLWVESEIRSIKIPQVDIPDALHLAESWIMLRSHFSSEHNF